MKTALRISVATMLALATIPIQAQPNCPCEGSITYNTIISHNSQLRHSWDAWNQNNDISNSVLDQHTGAQSFGHTFENVPFICEPMLTIEARPLPGGSANDRIYLQAAGGSYRWSSDIDQLPGLPPNAAWGDSLGSGWQTLTLDLRNLPGGQDLLEELVTTRLDVAIQDDTAVRSLRLSGRQCPGPGTSRETRCCGGDFIAWTDSSHTFLLNYDGNAKRAYWQNGPRAQWIQTDGTSPIVPGSFATLNDTTALLVNEDGQVVKVSPSGSSVIPNTQKVHPCSLTVTSRGIFGVRKDNGHVVLMNETSGEVQSVAPWGDDPHVIVENSLVEGADGRVLGVLRTGWPWNVYFDTAGAMQYATIGEAGKAAGLD